MQEELRKLKVKMRNTDLKGNVETVDISDLETVTERTELGLRVSKIEHMQETIQLLRSLSVIHLEYMG